MGRAERYAREAVVTTSGDDARAQLREELIRAAQEEQKTWSATRRAAHEAASEAAAEEARRILRETRVP